MSVCSATAAASSHSRTRKGWSASTAGASITEQQLIERDDKVNMNQNRTGTGRPSITGHLMDLTGRSRWVQTFIYFRSFYYICSMTFYFSFEVLLK